VQSGSCGRATRNGDEVSTLQKCGPYEPGTLSLVAVDDGCCFSYMRDGFKPRSPVPGERVRMRWHTGDRCPLEGEGLVVSVRDTGHSGPECMVLWSVEPKSRWRNDVR
jgi:hypothetical protein